ncbi:MAG: dihydropteroate synthase [Burkholderiaceae bacterium]|nr:dihydropteroate synthase [Burkholderiaceae bacterium]
MIWQTTRFSIDLARPQVMGIVNVTPDSFSDGGKHAVAGSALAHCEQLIHEGADILDIGGESSRPGAPPLPLADELARVLPVVREAIKLGVPISVDTYKPAVMQAVLDEGADIINDIWALRQPGALEAVARHTGCGICLMHMHREPQTMQAAPMEGDVLHQVLDFLARRTSALIVQGVNQGRIVWDAGTGFGKTVAQNFEMLARQGELLVAGYPLLAGWSRKSSLGSVTGLEVQDRLVPSVAAALMSVERGASIVRVHDVKETVSALKVWLAARDAAAGSGTIRP